MSKVEKAVKGKKPASKEAQLLAVKQEQLFAKIMVDKKFMDKVNKLKSILAKTDMIQSEFKKLGTQVGIKASRAKLKRMLKGEVTAKVPKIKPIVEPKLPIKKPISEVVKPTKFVEAKTLAEAEIEWKKYGELGTPLDLLPVIWDSKKELDVMNLINNQMHNMQGWIKNRKILRLSIVDGKKSFHGFCSKNIMKEVKLKLNFRIDYLDPTKDEKIFGSLIKNRWHISGKSMPVTLRHEMAHAMWNDVPRSMRDLTSIFEKKYYKGNRITIMDNISEYATTHVEEFFAETFAIYSSPKYVFGSLNKVFGKGFEELIEDILMAGVK